MTQLEAMESINSLLLARDVKTAQLECIRLCDDLPTDTLAAVLAASVRTGETTQEFQECLTDLYGREQYAYMLTDVLGRVR